MPRPAQQSHHAGIGAAVHDLRVELADERRNGLHEQRPQNVRVAPFQAAGPAHEHERRARIQLERGDRGG